MSLWCDKHRPKQFKDLDFGLEQAKKLERMVQEGDFPHLMIYGPTGAGKKTRVNCILRELYGSGVEKMRLERHEFTTPSNKKVEIHSSASNYHIEICPADAGVHDRVVIQGLVKEVAGTRQINSEKQKQFKVILITEANRLSKDAQHALRRTMEKFMAQCRLILITESISKLIPALRSRCLGIRVQAPTDDELIRVIDKISTKETWQMEDRQLEKLAKLSNRNLRKALLLSEICKVKGISDGNPPEYDWEIYLKETARKIIEQQSPSQVLVVRSRLYELLVRLIPPNIIFQVLFYELNKACIDSSMKSRLAKVAAEFEHRCNLGSKPIYHLEAFVTRFMSDYKSFNDQFKDDFDDDF
jgi:replication factor C subunit 3/5